MAFFAASAVDTEGWEGSERGGQKQGWEVIKGQRRLKSQGRRRRRRGRGEGRGGAPFGVEN